MSLVTNIKTIPIGWVENLYPLHLASFLWYNCARAKWINYKFLKFIQNYLVKFQKFAVSFDSCHPTSDDTAKLFEHAKLYIIAFVGIVHRMCAACPDSTHPSKHTCLRIDEWSRSTYVSYRWHENCRLIGVAALHANDLNNGNECLPCTTISSGNRSILVLSVLAVNAKMAIDNKIPPVLTL